MIFKLQSCFTLWILPKVIFSPNFKFVASVSSYLSFSYQRKTRILWLNSATANECLQNPHVFSTLFFFFLLQTNLYPPTSTSNPHSEMFHVSPNRRRIRTPISDRPAPPHQPRRCLHAHEDGPQASSPSPLSCASLVPLHRRLPLSKRHRFD